MDHGDEVQDSELPRSYVPQAFGVREARRLATRLLRDGVAPSRVRVQVSGRLLGVVGSMASFVLAEVQ
jgi:hypothetical protein